MNDTEFNRVVEEIVAALKKKGYSPYEQILGYLTTNLEFYITRYDDARDKIKSLDKTKLKEYIEKTIIS